MKNEENKEVIPNQENVANEGALEYASLMRQILVHNDDFTPMEFVVSVLQRFFYMDRRQATETAMEAHVKGKALCGIYSKDFAESKVTQVVDYARKHEHPLICSME